MASEAGEEAAVALAGGHAKRVAAGVKPVQQRCYAVVERFLERMGVHEANRKAHLFRERIEIVQHLVVDEQEVDDELDQREGVDLVRQRPAVPGEELRDGADNDERPVLVEVDVLARPVGEAQAAPTK